MIEFIGNPSFALAVIALACLASVYSVVLGIWTIKKLPHTRDVARAVSILIVLVNAMYLLISVLAYAKGYDRSPMPIVQTIDFLHVMISILVLRLFLRPCYLEDEKQCRELS